MIPAKCARRGGGQRDLGPEAIGAPGIGMWSQASSTAPRFRRRRARSIRHARFEQVEVDGVTVHAARLNARGPPAGPAPTPKFPLGPLRFQGGAGLVAMGDIRVKQIIEGEEEFDGGGWVALAGQGPAPLGPQGGPIKGYEVQSSIWPFPTKGTSALWLGDKRPFGHRSHQLESQHAREA